MDIQNIVEQLRNEITRIGQVIGLLEAGRNNTPVKKRVGRPPGSNGRKAASVGKGHGLTPAGRRKLSLAMKARWAKRKGTAGASRTSTPVAAAGKPKKIGGITAAGRKKLSDAMKARWAARRRKSS